MDSFLEFLCRLFLQICWSECFITEPNMNQANYSGWLPYIAICIWKSFDLHYSPWCRPWCWRVDDLFDRFFAPRITESTSLFRFRLRLDVSWHGVEDIGRPGLWRPESVIFIVNGSGVYGWNPLRTMSASNAPELVTHSFQAGKPQEGCLHVSPRDVLFSQMHGFVI